MQGPSMLVALRHLASLPGVDPSLFEIEASWFSDVDGKIHGRIHNHHTLPTPVPTTGTLLQVIEGTTCETRSCMSVPRVTSDAGVALATAAQFIQPLSEHVSHYVSFCAKDAWRAAVNAGSFVERLEGLFALAVRDLTDRRLLAVTESLKTTFESAHADARTFAGSDSFRRILLGEAREKLVWDTAGPVSALTDRLHGTVSADGETFHAKDRSQSLFNPATPPWHSGSARNEWKRSILPRNDEELDALELAVDTLRPSLIEQVSGLEFPTAGSAVHTPRLTDTLVQLWRQALRNEISEVRAGMASIRQAWQDRDDLVAVSLPSLARGVDSHRFVTTFDPDRVLKATLVVPAPIGQMLTLGTDDAMVELGVDALDDALITRIAAFDTLVADGGLYRSASTAWAAAELI